MSSQLKPRSGNTRHGGCSASRRRSPATSGPRVCQNDLNPRRCTRARACWGSSLPIACAAVHAWVYDRSGINHSGTGETGHDGTIHWCGSVMRRVIDRTNSYHQCRPLRGRHNHRCGCVRNEMYLQPGTGGDSRYGSAGRRRRQSVRQIDEESTSIGCNHGCMSGSTC